MVVVVVKFSFWSFPVCIYIYMFLYLSILVIIFDYLYLLILHYLFLIRRSFLRHRNSNGSSLLVCLMFTSYCLFNWRSNMMKQWRTREAFMLKS